MSRFRVTYPSGEAEEVEQSDCDTIEQYANTKFGYVDYASHGVTVELIGDSVKVSETQEASSGELDKGRDLKQMVVPQGISGISGKEYPSQDA